MATASDVERRDRALIVTILTDARDGAVASFNRQLLSQRTLPVTPLSSVRHSPG
jgi:hypothetical protein